MGKTRLGLQVAAEVSELFADGVYFVALAPLSDAALVLPTIAQTLGIREAGSQPLLKSLQEELLPQQVLLLLDNFEQVVTAGIMVADLLAACPKLKALVTSRTVLRVRAEHEFAVPPLTLPTPKQRLPDLVTLSQYEAVALFIERAQAVKPDFRITNTNAPAVAEICARLDGLPLAIELAAARSKVYPPQTLLARLKQGLSILAGGARDLPVRQQTLHGTIAWSYDLLEPKEQRLFRRLAVFANGCTVQAAEQVCMAGAQLQGDILEELASLVDKSLLRQEEQEEGEARIWMLQTLREFGLERLAEAGETEVTRATHAAYYLAQAEEAEPHLRGTEQVSWLARLDQEYENLRVALAYLLERAEMASEQAEMALRLSGALWWFWVVRGYCREGWSFLERALARSEGVRASVQGKALYAAGWLADLQDDYEQAEALLGKSLALFRESGDKRGMANALYTLGNVARTRSDYATANALLQEAVLLFKEVGDTWGRANSLIRLARVSIVQGQYTRARSLLEESLVLSRAIGDKRGIAYTLANLALLLFFSQGKPAKAHALAEESLVLFREVGDKQLTAYALRILGQLILQQGDAARARELAEESVVTLKEIGDRWGTAQSLLCSASVAARQGDSAAARRLYEENLALLSELEDQELIASCLEGLGQVVAAQGEPRWAARLWGRAEALREIVGAPMPPVYRADYEQAVAATRTALGEEAFDMAWAEGRMMALEQVLSAPVSGPLPEAAEARQPSAPPAGRASPAPAGLTAREVEVLRLVAQGMTDKQIAEQLVIARRTVNWYLTSIYSKIGVSSRSAATHYVMKQQLI